MGKWADFPQRETVPRQRYKVQRNIAREMNGDRADPGQLLPRDLEGVSISASITRKVWRGERTLRVTSRDSV